MMSAMPTTDARHEWTLPGLFEVAPGVYRIPLPLPNDGLAAVNSYAVVDGDDLVLIDPGWGLTESREQLTAALRGLGAHPGDITHFLVTHHHRDHYTQAVLLRREFGTTISLGEPEKHSLQVAGEPRDWAFFPQYERLVVAGARAFADDLGRMSADIPHEHDIWEMPDRWLLDGAEYRLPNRSLLAVATPGHTRGHVVFRDDPAGLLFAGDHVLPHITPSIGFEAAPVELPLRDYLESLALVRGQPDARLLPAHGPVTDSAHARIDELLDHHHTRLDTILDTVARGAVTALESAGRITWTRRERRFDELNVFNQMLAILETATHLDFLVVQGRLTASRVDGVEHYAVP
jgi:glyoxylase-like metal-dependent hydrolase (beta-lactamase superfamily II)